MSGLIRRTGYSRPWPLGEARRQGARCELSDLLIPECGCRRHRGKGKDDDDGRTRAAEPEELDFS